MRTVLAGLPRSGTTWLAEIVAADPAVRLVHEPDNPGVDPYAHVAHADLPRLPELGSTDAAPPAYEQLWDVALAGGWPDSGFRRSAAHQLRRFGGHVRTPHALRPPAFSLAARFVRPATAPVLVKTTRAYLSLPWLARRADATTVVWRHPLNLVPAWQEQRWSGVLAARSGVVQRRFADTAAWPPPPEVERPGAAAIAWAVAVLGAIVLEDAARLGLPVVHHESACVDPEAALEILVGTLGRPVGAVHRRALARHDRDGSGFATVRRRTAEPERWIDRLSADDLDVVQATIERIALASPVAGAAWSASPACS